MWSRLSTVQHKREATNAHEDAQLPGQRVEYFAVLDGWRGIAALLVALRHIPVQSHFYDLLFVRNSYLFVDFFFVLSGFVITHKYGNRLTSARSFREFATRRFCRLWPLHIAVLSAFVALVAAKFVLVAVYGMRTDQAPFTGLFSPEGLLTSALFIHAFGIHDAPVWNRPSWSISTEFYTYLVFALLCSLATRLTRNGAQRARTLTMLASGVGAVSALVVISVSTTGMDVTTGVAFFRCLCGFLVGHLVYTLWQRRALLSRVAGDLEIWIVLLAGAFVLAAGTGWLSYCAPLIFGATVWVFAHDAGPVSRAMHAPAPVRLGLWSYSIYMVHAFVYAVVIAAAQLWERILGAKLVYLVPSRGAGPLAQAIIFPSELAGDLLVVALLLAVVGVSAVTYRLIERPGQSALNGYLVKRAPASEDQKAVTSTEGAPAPHVIPTVPAPG